MTAILGYPRADGRVGIRDVALVVYLVECARTVADRIAEGRPEVHAVGFGGCYPSGYAQQMLERLCTHPNVGAVALVSLGCEGFDRERLAQIVRDSGRPVTTLVIQQLGGTRSTVSAGQEWLDSIDDARSARSQPMELSDLVVGTICGGSDGTSGITANPVVGAVFDRLVAAGGTAIFEETGELIGCEDHMARRCVTAELGDQIVARVQKAATYYTAMGHGSFSPGNAEGGLTTLEEKSLGAYSKSGAGPIHGVVTPGQIVPTAGLYLLDVVPEGDPTWGFPNINDNAEIAELIAAGAHVILFTTGRGSVVGLRDLTCDQGLRQPRHLCPHARGHGHRRGTDPRGRRRDRGGRGRARDTHRRGRGWHAVRQRGDGPPRVRPHLQVVRACWPELPAPRAMNALTSRDPTPTVVHLGPGVFHRAHQAAYADRLLRQGSPAGAIWGVSFRSRLLKEALRRTGGTYHLVERSRANRRTRAAGRHSHRVSPGLLGACRRCA